MTVLDLYHQDGHAARKVASSEGGQWGGPCPKCGGNDRFCLWPEDGKGGHYWCRQCDMKGDAIQYLRDVRQLSYHQACEVLQITPNKKHQERYTMHKPQAPTDASRNDRWDPKTYGLPAATWMARASAVLEQAITDLWAYDHKNILEWLNMSRYLDDEDSIRPFSLGYIPRDLHEHRAVWGLPEEKDPQTGKEKTVWIPEGVVIPCRRGGQLVRLRVRRTTSPFQGKRYIFIPGGSPAPLIIDNHAPDTIIVESELDAILINQEAGDLVNTIALGALSMHPDTETHELIRRSRQTLLAFDSDENLSGAKAAWERWSIHYPRALRCPVIGGKDPTDARKNGADIRLWIEAALAGGAKRMTA